MSTSVVVLLAMVALDPIMLPPASVSPGVSSASAQRPRWTARRKGKAKLSVAPAPAVKPRVGGAKSPAAARVLPPAPPSDIARRIRAGELRDSVEGTYDYLSVLNTANNARDIFAVAIADKPFVAWAHGPGTLSVVVHRLVGAAQTVNVSDSLSIFDNGVLLRTFELDTPLAAGLIVYEDPARGVTTVQEFNVSLGPRLSRLVFLPAESATAGILVSYTFVPGDGPSVVASSAGRGGGIGGTTVVSSTTITEVGAHDTVAQETVAQVKQVKAEEVVEVDVVPSETVGIGITVGAIVPSWGGMPAPAAGLELQWILPLANGKVALCIEGQAQRHQLLSRGVESPQVELRSRAVVWAAPVRVGPTYRWTLSDTLRLAFGARGTLTYLSGKSDTLGGASTASATVLGASGLVSFEVRMGAGWWALDAGYDWAQRVDLGRVVRGFSPGGFAAGTRFRFVL